MRERPKFHSAEHPNAFERGQAESGNNEDVEDESKQDHANVPQSEGEYEQLVFQNSNKRVDENEFNLMLDNSEGIAGLRDLGSPEVISIQDDNLATLYVLFFSYVTTEFR